MIKGDHQTRLLSYDFVCGQFYRISADFFGQKTGPALMQTDQNFYASKNVFRFLVEANIILNSSWRLKNLIQDT